MNNSDKNHLIIYRIFPFLHWLKGYGVVEFREDLVAGLTVAVVLIPQSMAYAMVAGLPPVYGLYSAAVTPFVAALWGSLRQLGTGPIAIMSLLVLTTLTPLAEPGSKEFIELSFLLAFMVGILYFAIGLFRLGEIMSFISHSAVKGFTAATALIIIATQLPNLLGITAARHEFILPKLIGIASKVPTTNITTLIVGVVTFCIIYGLQRYKKNWPAALIALVLITIGIVVFELHDTSIAIVGETPRGLPRFHVPMFNLKTVSTLIGPAIVISLVSFAETYSVGKAISAETKQKVDVNQEFIGQGMANLIGSFFQSYPVSGSFSRTAIAYSSGAKTGISSVVASLAVVVTLLFLTPVLAFIPKTALAAMVISAVLTLFHPKEVFNLWKKNRHDGIVAVTVFLLTLVSKPDYALLIGVAMSLMMFLWKTMHPRIVRETRDPELEMFVNADLSRKPSCPQILQLRSDNSIYFANAKYTIEHLIERLDAHKGPLKYLVLDLQVMGFIDLTGVDELRSLLEDVRSRGAELALTDVHLPVKQALETAGFLEEMNPEYLIDNRRKAIAFLFQHLDYDYCKGVCPYELFMECPTVK
jgi:sulfate permease, SulP family